MLVLYVVLVIMSVLVFFWFEGHFGEWGKVAKAYPLHENVEKPSYSDIVSFGSIASSWNSANVELSKGGIDVVVQPWIRWALPSIRVPWHAIGSMKYKQAIIFSQVELKLLTGQHSLLIPGKYVEACKTYMAKRYDNTNYA